MSFSIDSRFELYFNSGPVTSTLGYASEISKNGLLVGATYPTAEISLSGLNTALTYDLTFYASVGSNGNGIQDRRMLINAFGDNAAEQEALNVYSTATTSDEAMVTIYGIRPDLDGGIQITFSYPSSETIRGHINAISITAIPEPGSIAFLSIGAFAMIATLYRKRS